MANRAHSTPASKSNLGPLPYQGSALPLTRRAALTLSALITLPIVAAAMPSHAAAEPDAELIRLCAAHPKAVQAYNDDSSDIPPEKDPLWKAVTDIEDRIAAIPATTFAGLVAKAQVARHQATDLEGYEDYAQAENWCEQVIRDLLAMAERGQA